MPFASKRQQRAMYAGAIPGLDKNDAAEWSKDTDFSKLPERAASQKGKPTMRSKKAAIPDFMPVFDALAEVFKLATLGSAAAKASNVGKLRGMMTTHSMKAPGFAASAQATNPRRNLINAMNFGKPH